jgi:MarR family transcriptional regulator, transcriptional regulator for hemolysin
MTRNTEQHPGILLHDIARLFRQGFGHQLRDLRLTEPQWRALGSINRFPMIGQSDLADLLGISRAPLGKLVDKLESEKLIERISSATDRRSKKLRITKTGKPIANQIRRRLLKFQDQLLLELDPESRHSLLLGLNAVYEELSGQSVEELIPGDEKPSLMLLIAIISRLNSRNFDLQLRRLGFTRNQWLVLVAISREEGLQQSQLARELNMHKAALGNLIDDLENHNRVHRRSAPQDRRAHELYLSDECKSGMQALIAEFEAMHEQAVQSLGQRQRQQLSKSLDSIRKKLKEIARNERAVGEVKA